ncbi:MULTISPECIES: PilW family protein [unclassified Lentimonas]|uniref:PilW family protein n=1 Tax=unclassified Lentimonas TaxID=2630993 RepID=UPI0013899D9F|nr:MULTISPECIES: prepilin-type N-terminal cleavage/methylation domain-containing protein [unclassified Lentimonas]
MIISNRFSEPRMNGRRLMPPKTRGFTLVEIMVTLTVFSMVMASLMATFLVFSKGMVSLGNYGAMSSSSRQTLEHFSRDVHATQSLQVATANEFECVLPAEAGGYTINYKYDPNTSDFTRKKYSSGGTLLKTDVLFEDVETFEMIFYNRSDVDVTGDTSILNEAKTVQINAKLVKNVISQTNSDYIISARFLMRNM